MYISNVSKRLRELNQPNDIDKEKMDLGVTAKCKRLGLLYKYSEDKENAESTGRYGFYSIGR